MAHIEAPDLIASVRGTDRREHNPLLAFAVSDLAAFILALAISTLSAQAETGAGGAAGSGLAGAALILALMAWFRSQGHYRARHALSNQVRPVLAACGAAFMAAVTARAALDGGGGVVQAATMWGSAPVLVIALRLAARFALRAAGLWTQPVVLIAASSSAQDSRTILERNTGHGLAPERIVPLESLDALTPAELAARLDALDGGAPIYLAPDEAGQPAANRIVAHLTARGAMFFYQPALGRVPTQNIDLIDYPPADGFVFRIADSLDRPVAQSFKRAADAIAAGLGLLALSPLMVAIALLIRRDGGPALFVQPRVGRGGRMFGCLKFRSMTIDAERRLAEVLAADPDKAAEWAAYQKLSDDPRVTAVGRFIRRFSLDELPQLINVLRGEMSLVGPRPMTPDQQSDYGEALASYIRMRPGITGMWQVNGRNETTFAERARLDDWYARNWSMWRDAVILARTVRELAAPSGR